MNYRDGTDLIMGAYVTDTFKAFGHSTGCKVSNSAETATRKTKEAAAGKWDETYVKTLSCQVTADGFVYKGDTMGYPELMTMYLAATPVTLRWGYRDEVATKYYEGSFVITALDLDGQAGDDEKWSVTFASSGAIELKTAG